MDNRIIVYNSFGSLAAASASKADFYFLFEGFHLLTISTLYLHKNKFQKFLFYSKRLKHQIKNFFAEHLFFIFEPFIINVIDCWRKWVENGCVKKNEIITGKSVGN